MSCGKTLFPGALLLFLFTLAPGPALAVSNIQNLIVSPSSVTGGSTVTITFQFKSSNTGCKTAYFAALSNQCALRNAGAAGQVLLVGENGINVVHTQINVGRVNGPLGDNAWHPSSQLDATISMTIPAAWTAGTYYAIVAVRDCNIYANPNLAVDNQACAQITVTAGGRPLIDAATPKDTTTVVGRPASFTVSAVGSTPITYSWYRVTAGSSVKIAGPVSNPTLSFANALLTDSGSYYCIAGNAAGLDTSRTARLGVITPLLKITNDLPLDTTADIGVPFAVSLTASGTEPISYLWYRDTVAGTPLAGQISSTLTLSNIKLSDSGRYVCLVSDANGMDTSRTMHLAVSLAPPSITGIPANTAVLVGDTGRITVSATGARPMTYAWYRTSVAPPTIITGQNTATLAIPNVTLSDSGAYFCVLTNGYGSDTTIPGAILTPLHPQPVIISQPKDTAVLQGRQCSFTVTAQVAGNVAGVQLTYQWYKKSVAAGNEVSGGTGAQISFASTQITDSGNYLCVVSTMHGTQTYGAVTSSAGHMTVAQNWSVSNPITLVGNIPGQLIDSSHVRLRITRYMGLPLTAPALFPWHADTVEVWYRAAQWPTITGQALKFSLRQLQNQAGDQYDTVVAVPPRPVPGCFAYYFRGSVLWHRDTGAKKDSIPPLTDTGFGAAIYMCDTNPIVNPLVLALQYTAPSDSLLVTLSGLSDARIRWDLVASVKIHGTIAGSTTAIDTVFPKSRFPAGTPTFTFTVRDARFTGEEKMTRWEARFGSVSGGQSAAVRDSIAVGVPHPVNTVKLDTGVVGVTQVGLRWSLASPAVDSIRIWYGTKRVPTSSYTITGYPFVRAAGTDTAATITGLLPDSTYYFGLQVFRWGLASLVTPDASVSATMHSLTDTTPIPNKIGIIAVTFDTATNRVRLDYRLRDTGDISNFVCDAGITWRSDSAGFTAQPSSAAGDRIATIFNLTAVQTAYLEVNGSTLQFGGSYHFGIWLRKSNGAWSGPVDSSMRWFSIPMPSWMSVSFFPTVNTVYGFNGGVVLQKDTVFGNNLVVTGKLRDVQLPTGVSGCIPVSRAFRFEPQSATWGIPYYFGIKYDSVPGGFSAADIRVYRYDTTRKVWLVDTAAPAVSGLVVSILTKDADYRNAYVLMIDTVPPKVEVLSDTAGVLPAGTDVPVTVVVRDNISNVKLSFEYGSGEGGYVYRKDTLASGAADTSVWVIRGGVVISSFGVRARLRATDGRFTEVVDLSREVQVSNSDAMSPMNEKWVPLSATAVLDSPAVSSALSGFAENNELKYDTKVLRLFRWLPGSWNSASAAKWVEYTGAQKDQFAFVPGRVVWLKTRKSDVINFGNGHSVSLKTPCAITLPAKNWTDFCLPYRFNIRIGDVLLATDSTARQSLLFYQWRHDDKYRYATQGFYLPQNAGLNDPKSELVLTGEDGERVAYSVWNDLGSDVVLQIPPTPGALSGISKERFARIEGWTVEVSASCADGPLSPVYCSYVKGGGAALSYPLPPAWSGVSAGIFDETGARVCGDVVARQLTNGGYAYQLVFKNDQEAGAVVSWSARQLAGESMQTAVLDPESGTTASARTMQTVAVAPHSRAYRMLAVGSPGYIRDFGKQVIRGEFALLRIVPNPVRGKVVIDYRIPYSGVEAVRCDIFDQRGRVVWSYRAGAGLHPGKNSAVWNEKERGGLAAGAYIIRIAAFSGAGGKVGEKLAKVMYLP